MLANGPAWTNASVFSVVCMMLGLIASFIIAVIAPATRRSSAVICLPSGVSATTIRPSRLRMSCRSVESPSIAMTSLAAAMS